MKLSLAAARVNAGYTQAEAASKIGVSIGSIVRWENYKAAPNIADFKRLCNLYHVSMDDIILPVD